jgi:PAS domain S-box-containing protein
MAEKRGRGRPPKKTGQARPTPNGTGQPKVPIRGPANGPTAPRVDTERTGADDVTRRLAAIVEHSTDAIFSKDMDGNIQTWNRGAERLYGYTYAEVIGRSVSVIIPPDRTTELASFMARLRAGETIEQVETERLRKDGRRVSISLTLSPIRDGNGKIVAASAVVREIGDRKRAEHALRDSERRAADDLASMIRLQQVIMQLVTSGKPTALLLEILDTAIANTVADMGNIQLMDPVSGSLNIVASRGFKAPFLEFFNAVHEGRAACGTALQTTTRVVIEDVTTSPVFVGTRALEVLLAAGVRAVQSTPLVSRSGRIVGMLSTHSRRPHRPGSRDLRVIDLLARQAADWIERTRDEATLRESEQRYRLMADAAPVMIWTSGTDRRCTWFNRAWLDFVGRSMEKELGDGWAENVHVDDAGRCLNTYASAFESRAPFSMEYRLKRHDGEFRWMLDNGTPMFFGDEFAGYIGSCTDVTDLKRVQEQLVDSEQSTRRLLEFQEAVTANMGEGLFTVDMHGRVTYLNATAERLFGWTSADLLGRQMHEAVHHHYPDGRPFPVDECMGYRSLNEKKGITECEEVFIRRDGTFFPVNYNSAPLISDGKLSGRVVVFRDVTERRGAEDALHRLTAELRSQVEELRTILDILPCGILKADPGFRDIIANRAFTEMTGFRHEADAPLAVMRGTLPAGTRACRAGRELAFDELPIQVTQRTGRRILDFDLELAYPDGRVMSLLVNTAPLLDESGAVRGVVGAYTDITGRKQVEQALRDREERLRTILHTAADAIVTIDRQGRIVATNPATERLFGYGEAELVGQNVTVLMPSPYKDEHDGYLSAFLKTGVKHIIGTIREVQARRKDGTLFPADLAVSEVERLGLFTGIIRDISRRKELEREVVEIAALEQRRIGQDLHDSVAQDLTALNLLAGDLKQSLQANRPDTADLARLISRGLQTSQHALRAVMRGLLPVSVDSQGLMAALADLADRTRQLGKAVCTFDCPEPVPVADNLTATHLYLIAQEAVHNAIKHALAGDVRIGLRSDGNLILTVKDNGIGMPDRPTGAQGLGLRIMRNRAAIVGATLRISRAEPHGTLVRCELPRSRHET